MTGNIPGALFMSPVSETRTIRTSNILGVKTVFSSIIHLLLFISNKLLTREVDLDIDQ